MVKALFDTNILIDFLNAVIPAREELDRYDERAISIVTWMEVMIGADAEFEARTRAFLSTFQIVPIEIEIAERTVELRRESRIKLPDAVIRASAEIGGMLLVTRNTKDFPSDDPGVRVPYAL